MSRFFQDQVSRNPFITGYLWRINKRISIPELHTGSNKLQWFRLQHSVNVFSELRSTQYCSQTWQQIRETRCFQDLDQVKQDEFDLIMSAGNGLPAEEYDKWASNLRQETLKRAPSDSDFNFKVMTSTFLIRLLYLLRDKDELEAADAIWQSIRKNNWFASLSVVSNQARGWFNSVADFPPMTPDGTIPFTEQIIMDMIQLDYDHDGTFHQCWIIDNLMRDGWLAVGKFVRVSTDDIFMMHPGWMEVNEDVTTMHNIECPQTQSAISWNTDRPLCVNPARSEVRPFDFSPYGDVQVYKQLIRSSTIANGITLLAQQLDRSEIQGLYTESIVAGGLEDEWGDAMRGRGTGRLSSMEAVFDVNELLKIRQIGVQNNGSSTVFVLTPFDNRLENLPHPPIRAAPMSWIVEPTGERPDGKGGLREVVKKIESVKGVWRFLDRPLTEYKLV
jgi:hypothetical protein